MADRLVASVLGNRNSGKSHTWNTLFNSTVRTGTSERRLWLNNCEYVSVFLVSGSPEERELYVGEIIANNNPSIVLCSMQYTDSVHSTIEYFRSNQYELFVQWLNPGRHDDSQKQDSLGIFQSLIDHTATVSVRSGASDDAQPRVNEIRNFIYGWAKPRGLIGHEASYA